MNQPSGGLSTRVGRRVLAMFAASALLPVAISIGVFYGWIKTALVESREAQLAQAVQSYTSSLLERLMTAEASLHDIEHLGNEASNHRWFRTVALIEGSAPARMLIGAASILPSLDPAPDAIAHLDAGRATIAVHADNAGLLSVWMLRRSHNGSAMLIAEVRSESLWGEADDLPSLTSACVIDNSRRALYCSAPDDMHRIAEIHPKVGHAPFGRGAWSDGEVRYRTSYREVFLPSHFRAPSWLVVVSQPESRALATAETVGRIFVPAIALGLLIALFLGSAHVRRTLGPLAALRSATRRLAAREFDARVQPAGNDEFTELGHAFNDMSAQLGHQFDAMRALAEIDGVILSKLSIERIAEHVVQRIAELVPADRCQLMIAESARARRFALYASGIDAAGAAATVVLDAPLIERLLENRDGVRKSGRQCQIHTSAGVPLLAPDSVAFVLPVVIDEALAALIVVTHPEGAAPNADHIELLKRLADRIAVAIEAARRDAELQRNANFDSLTQLPNRRLFMTELPREIARAQHENTQLTMLFVDLDGFSSINDTFGHAVGDELLVQAAQRLRASVRKWDMVARLGGDEFVATLLELPDARQAARIAEHCVDALSKPFELSTGTAFVSASIGIAMFPADGANADTLLQHADMAMYRAKANGRAGYAFFEADMDREAQGRMTMNVDLRRAIERREFVLHYQPQLDVRTQRLGVEALIRWNHPTRGLLKPSEFIGIAEETGLIEAIGQWIIERASRQFVAWRRQGLLLEHISVNVSPRQFRQRDFAELVTRLVQATRIDPRELHLEITESVLLEGPDTLQPTLAALQSLGTPLELDDFGTGYSSLAYLQRLPVSTIKLDRSFVIDIEASQNSRALVRAAVEMVHALGKQIVVEGVETPGQAALLREWGCDAIQGYLLSQPLPAEAFATFVRARQSTATMHAATFVE